jgi:hypothetical protein
MGPGNVVILGPSKPVRIDRSTEDKTRESASNAIWVKARQV